VDRPSSKQPPRLITQETLRQVRPVEFFKNTWAEMRKVTWPSREETLRLTGVVLVLSLAVGFLLGALDYILSQTFVRFVLGT